MKKKIYYTAGILPIAAGILASFLTADAGYLLLTACFLCCYLPVFSGIRKKYEDDRYRYPIFWNSLFRETAALSQQKPLTAWYQNSRHRL
ncbi:hypothetical protein LC724_25125 [Blautia sp. RD014234]|nr:hypothetical protein [Blautia parvula]